MVISSKPSGTGGFVDTQQQPRDRSSPAFRPRQVDSPVALTHHQPPRPETSNFAHTMPSGFNFAGLNNSQSHSRQLSGLISNLRTDTDRPVSQTLLQDLARPPTPTRQLRTSDHGDLLTELQSLRSRVATLEAENARLKSRLNGGSSELSALQAEVDRLRANEQQTIVQADLLEKQRRSLEAAADVKTAYKSLRHQAFVLAETLRLSAPTWFVGFCDAACQPE